jgi:hypothetical protein
MAPLICRKDNSYALTFNDENTKDLTIADSRVDSVMLSYAYNVIPKSKDDFCSESVSKVLSSLEQGQITFVVKKGEFHDEWILIRPILINNNIVEEMINGTKHILSVKESSIAFVPKDWHAM